MTDKKVIVVIEAEISMEDINARIKQEVSYKTLEELSDAKLMCEYKDCKSVKNEIKKNRVMYWENILVKKQNKK
jgi:hypothetical protein